MFALHPQSHVDHAYVGLPDGGDIGNAKLDYILALSMWIQVESFS